MEKATLVFHIYKIWQILKRFSRQLTSPHIPNFLRVNCYLLEISTYIFDSIALQVLRDRVVVTEDGPRIVAEILVRKVPDDRQCIDLRVCILGSADVGKSTLLGVLTQGRYTSFVPFYDFSSQHPHK